MDHPPQAKRDQLRRGMARLEAILAQGLGDPPFRDLVERMASCRTIVDACREAALSRDHDFVEWLGMALGPNGSIGIALDRVSDWNPLVRDWRAIVACAQAAGAALSLHKAEALGYLHAAIAGQAVAQVPEEAGQPDARALADSLNDEAVRFVEGACRELGERLNARQDAAGVCSLTLELMGRPRTPLRLPP